MKFLPIKSVLHDHLTFSMSFLICLTFIHIFKFTHVCPVDMIIQALLSVPHCSKTKYSIYLLGLVCSKCTGLSITVARGTNIDDR